MLCFANRCKSGTFGYFNIQSIVTFLIVGCTYRVYKWTKVIFPWSTFLWAFYIFQWLRHILALTLSRHGCIYASHQQLRWVFGSAAASSWILIYTHWFSLFSVCGFCWFRFWMISLLALYSIIRRSKMGDLTQIDPEKDIWRVICKFCVKCNTYSYCALH